VSEQTPEQLKADAEAWWANHPMRATVQEIGKYIRGEPSTVEFLTEEELRARGEWDVPCDCGRCGG